MEEEKGLNTSYCLLCANATWSTFLYSYGLEISHSVKCNYVSFLIRYFQNSGDAKWLLAELVTIKTPTYPWGPCRREQASFSSLPGAIGSSLWLKGIGSICSWTEQNTKEKARVENILRQSSGNLRGARGLPCLWSPANLHSAFLLSLGPKAPFLFFPLQQCLPQTHIQLYAISCIDIMWDALHFALCIGTLNTLEREWLRQVANIYSVCQAVGWTFYPTM